MAYTKYSLTPANNTATPPDGAPEGMLPSAVNDTMRDMMAQIRDCGDGIRDGTYTMTAPKITGGTITGSTINNSAIGGTTAAAGAFTTLSATGVTTVQAGSVSAPAITTTGDTNTGIYFPAADTIAFTEGGVESMRIDSSGNVGIGTSSPTVPLQIYSATNAAILMQGDAGANVTIQRYSTNATQPSLILFKARGTLASPTAVASNDQLGSVVFQAYGGTNTRSIAGIRGYAETYTSDTDISSYLWFGTTPSGTTSISERMRIDSSGNVGIGTSSPTQPLHISKPQGAALIQSTTSTNSAYLAFNNGGGTSYVGVDTSTGSIFSSGAYGMTLFNAANSATTFFTNATEKMRITSAGNVGIGTSSPTTQLQVVGAGSGTFGPYNDPLIVQASAGGYTYMQLVGVNGQAGVIYNRDGSTGWFQGLDNSGNLKYATMSAMNGTALGNAKDSSTPSLLLTTSGNLLVATTSSDVADANGTGASFSSAGNAQFSRASGGVMNVNRKTDDGVLVYFQQDASAEGNISVSGTTVSYNGGHLSRWSQLPNNQKDNTLLKGTVMSNLDDMCVWTKDGEVLPNEQLNKMKVSDIDGDTNVAGVFVSWEFDEQCQSDDMNVAMTGDMIIRIAEGVVVQKGDLLMSAGDGTAKPQGDDIRKSKTIAKVTSNYVTCTYADGSYCVPCVLMAC
jgi:hypothetical protein